jgi:aldose 1-epimerase
MMPPEKHLNPFTAEVATDLSLNTTVITLSYMHPSDPARNITIGLAPELGCNMFRFRVGEHDLIYSDPELLMQKAFTGCFVLWPLPNRLRNKQYVYQGHTYSLADIKRPFPDNHLVHGLVLDRSWLFDDPVTVSDSASVTAYVDMLPDSPFYEGYPFESRLSLTFTLKANGVTISYEVKNNGTKDMPYGFALHPYFSLLSGKQESYISLPADKLMEADPTLLPTGRILNFDGIMYAMYDLRQPTQLEHLSLDHVYTGIHHDRSSVLHLRQLHLKLHATASDEFTHIVIYVPRGDPFMCLENQTCSTDAPNLAARGQGDIAHLLEVHPGESATGYIQYNVEYDQ